MDGPSSPRGFAGHHASPFRLRRGSATRSRRAKRGGARRDRTADLVIANDALSQLSYGPSAAAPDTSQGQPAVGAIYNPRQGQVKNAETAIFVPPLFRFLLLIEGH